jgi:hypothetical protein
MSLARAGSVKSSERALISEQINGTLRWTVAPSSILAALLEDELCMIVYDIGANCEM